MVSKSVVTWAIVGLVAGTAFGGAFYKVRCTDKKCGLESDFNFGGGFTFHEAAGYCVKCNAFVSVTWGRQTAKGPVEAAPFTGEIWDSHNGKRMQVFPCPTCKGPVAEIKSDADLKVCPKCSKAPVTTQPVGSYD